MQFYQREKFDYKKYIDTDTRKPDKTNYGLISFVLMFVGIGTLLVWVDNSYQLGESLVASVHSILQIEETDTRVDTDIEQHTETTKQEETEENIIIPIESPRRELNKPIYSLSYPSSLYAVRDVQGDTEIITFYDRDSLDVRAEGNGNTAIGLTLIAMMKPDQFSSLERFAEKNALGSWEYSKEMKDIEFENGKTVNLPVYSVTTTDGLYDFYFYTEEGYPYILSFMYPTDDNITKLQDDYYSVITSLDVKNYDIPSDYRDRLNAIVEDNSI
jgi:hypothetical protein